MKILRVLAILLTLTSSVAFAWIIYQEINSDQATDDSSALVSLLCSNGLEAGQCSKFGPSYCDSSGQIVNNCQKCGCPALYVECSNENCLVNVCQADGSCKVENNPSEFDSSLVYELNNPRGSNTQCALSYAPVCGSDGTTYSNSCYAGIMNTSIKCFGVCPCGDISDTVNSEGVQSSYNQSDEFDAARYACVGIDSNTDGIINIIDLASFASYYGTACSTSEEISKSTCGSIDTDENGTINLIDLSIFASMYGNEDCSLI